MTRVDTQGRPPGDRRHITFIVPQQVVQVGRIGIKAIMLGKGKRGPSCM